MDECSNLRTIQASGGGSIQGKFGVLEDYEFAASGSGSYEVVPPDSSDCARDIAARLEGACRICRESESACESTVQQVLDTPTQYCTACGDNLCGGDETPANCPQDCADACGNGTCEGTESFQSCPADCSQSGCGDGQCAPGENPVNCPIDCGTACGDGRCAGDESPSSCPQDCDQGVCGDARCNFGETAENCRQDCGGGCGNGACEGSESGFTCPQDCGGCTPNTSTCQGSAVLACNADGASTTARACGAGSFCRDGVCHASDPQSGQEEAEAQLLGFWDVSLTLRTDADEEAVEAEYTLEIFQVSPPTNQFGVWNWKGALKPAALCAVEAADRAQGGPCQRFEPTLLGTCSGVSCTPSGAEEGVQGTWSAIDGVLALGESPRAEGHMYAFNANEGYLALRANVYGAGQVVNDRLLPAECAGVWCTWSLTPAAGTTLAERFGTLRGDGWSLEMSKITGR